MPVDLHLHSARSDGTDEPRALVELAATAGLAAIALTDHDTLDGLPEAADAAEEAGIGFVPGTELSLEWPLGTMHLLVYHLLPGQGPLQDRLEGLRRSREKRNEEIVARLRAAGVALSYEEVLDEAVGGVVGRPHIAAVMVRRGEADSIADAFDRWLARGRPGYVERMRLGPEEAIELAGASGAVPVLAHPHTIGVSSDEYAGSFSALADVGLAGIEAYYGEYPSELKRHLAHLAERLGLVATGGSDYHGRYKPGLRVGIGRGDLRVPDETVEAIAAMRPGRRRG